MVGFGPPHERGEQVVADRADVEFVELPAAGRGDQRDETVAGESHFGPAVEVVVVRLGVDPRPAAPESRSSRLSAAIK